MRRPAEPTAPPPAETDPDTQPLSRFLHPRYWPTWLGLSALWLLSRCPWSWQLAVGRRLGNLTRLLLHRRVRIAQVNLALCFPQRSARERQRLLKAHFRALGMGLVETAASWWCSNARVRGLGSVSGAEHFHAARADGRGVILLTGHFTTMELAAHILFLHGVPFDAMYRPMKNALMDAVVRNARVTRGDTVFSRDDTRAMLRSLKAGHAVWYGPDQNYGLQHSVFVPFLGVPAATITTTARFAAMTGARVVPYFPRRLPSGRYAIEVLPALGDFPSGDAQADARRINALIEAQVLRIPEQYLWVHRRFKTRPPGLDPVY